MSLRSRKLGQCGDSVLQDLLSVSYGSSTRICITSLRHRAILGLFRVGQKPVNARGKLLRLVANFGVAVGRHAQGGEGVG